MVDDGVRATPGGSATSRAGAAATGVLDSDDGKQDATRAQPPLTAAAQTPGLARGRR